MRALFIGIALFLLSVTLAHAQDATPEAAAGWTIEQRCVGEPVERPENWTFDGTILMTGYAGIHGVNDDWETPHVVVFLSTRTVPVMGEHHFLAGYDGVLSPDGLWFAVVEGYTTECVNLCWGVNAEAIRVHSTINPRESYSMAWSNSYGVGATGLPHPLFWYDTNHLLYESDTLQRESGGTGGDWLINPFTGELTEWQTNISPHSAYYHPSPDWTHEIYASDSWATEVWLSDGDATTPLLMNPQVAWSPDSSQFAAYTFDANFHNDQLVLFNSSGDLTDTLLDIVEGSFARLGRWSSDGRYFTFMANTLHIADVIEHRVIDTCLSVNDQQVWSIDNNQIAILAPYDNQRFAVQVLDLERWQRYTVAYHQGEVIGWRADD